MSKSINILIVLVCLVHVQVLAQSRALPLLSIGVVADPQYANTPSRGERYYKMSLDKLSSAIDTFNHYSVNYVQTLGDVIDGGWGNFDSVMPVYSRLKSKITSYHLLGNHEFAIEEPYLSDVKDKLGMPNRYYTYRNNGWRMVVLDATDVSSYSAVLTPKRERKVKKYQDRAMQSNKHEWNGAIGSKQQRWLKHQLKEAQKAGEKVVIFSHMPVQSTSHTEENLWNDQRIVELIEKRSCVKLYVNGHNHSGDFVIKNHVRYVTIHGMVETKANSFGVLLLFNSKIELVGFGNQESYYWQFEKLDE